MGMFERLLIPFLGGALLLTGCAPAVGSSSSSSAAPTRPPTLLRIGMQISNEPDANTEGVASPAPFGGSGSGSSALEHFFTFHAPLTLSDQQSNIVPSVAQKIPSLQDGDWKVTSTGMEVTWKIRPDVKWHDGQPLTADDY